MRSGPFAYRRQRSIDPGVECIDALSDLLYQRLGGCRVAGPESVEVLHLPVIETLRKLECCTLVV